MLRRCLLLLVTVMLATVTTQEQRYREDDNYSESSYAQGNYYSKFLQHLEEPSTTSRGPVLFPNDGPPTPRPPLIVTSRPLSQIEVIPEENNQPQLYTDVSDVDNTDYVQIDQEANRKADFAQYFKNLRARQKKRLKMNTNLSRHNLDPLINREVESPLYETIRNDKLLVATPRPLLSTTTIRNLIENQEQSLGSKSNVQWRPSPTAVTDDRYNEIIYEAPKQTQTYREYKYPVDEFRQRNPSLPPIYRVLAERAKYNLDNPKLSSYDMVNDIQYIDTNEGDSIIQQQGDKYAFSYIVRDTERGDDYSHKQTSTGQATNGEYRVKLPDGRTQIVSYIADDNGYKADVKYDYDSINRIDNNIESNNKIKTKIYIPNDIDNEKPIKLNTEFNEIKPDSIINYRNGISREFNDGSNLGRIIVTDLKKYKDDLDVKLNSYLYNKIPVMFVSSTPVYDNIQDKIGVTSLSTIDDEISTPVPELITRNLNKPGFINFLNKINKYLTFV